MARDVSLAHAAEPAVRLYQWDPPAVSLGLKQPAPAWAREATELAVVERPTGGGMAFHGSDVSVAVVVPRALGYTLAFIMSAACRSALRLCHAFGVEARAVEDAPRQSRITYCLSELSPYAVLMEPPSYGGGGIPSESRACRGTSRGIAGRKVAGFAIRRYPESWLVQGSLLVRPLPEALERAMPCEVAQQLATSASPLSAMAMAEVEERVVAQRWAAEWPACWEQGAA